MDCSQCGTPLPETAKFCLECGSPVSAAPSTPGPAVQQGVGVVKDNAAVVGAIQGGKGPVHVGGQQYYGDTYVLAPEDRSDPVALRQAYLHRVLEQTQTLQLTGVDPKAAQDATARSGLEGSRRSATTACVKARTHSAASRAPMASASSNTGTRS